MHLSFLKIKVKVVCHVCGGMGKLTRHSGFNKMYVFGVTAPLF